MGNRIEWRRPCHVGASARNRHGRGRCRRHAGDVSAAQYRFLPAALASTWRSIIQVRRGGKIVILLSYYLHVNHLTAALPLHTSPEISFATRHLENSVEVIWSLRVSRASRAVRLKHSIQQIHRALVLLDPHQELGHLHGGQDTTHSVCYGL